MKIEICNFKKYNARQDQKSFSWFRFEHDFFSNDNFIFLSPQEKLCWIYVLCKSSKSNSDQIDIEKEVFEHQVALQYEICCAALEKLETRKVLKILERSDACAVDRSCALHTDIHTNIQTDSDLDKESIINNKKTQYNPKYLEYSENWNKYCNWVKIEYNCKLPQIKAHTEDRDKIIKKHIDKGLTLDLYRQALTYAAQVKDKDGKRFYISSYWFTFDWMFRTLNEKKQPVCNWLSIIEKGESK